MTNRRGFLQLAAAAGVGVGVAGSYETVLGLVPFTSRGRKAANAVWGNATEPEWVFDRTSGTYGINPNFTLRHTVDLQCHSECGLRVKIDKRTGRIVRIIGNPYHKNTREAYLAYETPLRESAATPGTVCARGNTGIETVYDPYRVTVPLKRVGPRGSGRWKPLDWERFIEEVVEGGRIFADTGDPLSKDVEVLGFRGLYEKRGEPMDPEAPEMGRRTNGLLFQGGRIKASRVAFTKRFMAAFGSVNFFEHTNVCELSHHIATEMVFPPKHAVKPDVVNARFLMFWGTSPGDANFPMQTVGRMVAQARANGTRYVCIDPVAHRGSVVGEFAEWVPIEPGTDGALAMGMVRWIIENERYNAHHLSFPNREAALANGELAHTDATHLVIVEPGHPREGGFLDRGELAAAAAAVGGEKERAPLDEAAAGARDHPPGGDEREGAPFRVVDEDAERIVIDAATGTPRPASEVQRAVLDYEGTVNGLRVKTAFRLLKESAFEYGLEDYSRICGVPVEKIVDLAREFTSHGRRAACEFYRGPVKHPNGFHNGHAILMLNLLIGNCNWRGGISAGGGGYPSLTGRYDLKTIPGLESEPEGVKLSREKAYYELSTEYRKKVEAGQNPYPAKRPWYPHTFNVYSELLPSALERYPYGIDILIWHMATPLYAVPGQGNEEMIEKLKDPRNIPLIIGSDIVVGDTTMYADYILPDTTFMERWVHIGMHEITLVKGTAVRWPVIEPLTGKTKDGRHFSLETFLIDVAERLGLPGFGAEAIPDAKGRLWPLHRREDFFLKATANLAFAGEEPVPEISAEDRAICDLDSFQAQYADALEEEEWPRTLMVLARGGRFEPRGNAWDGDRLGHQYTRRINIYAEPVALSRNAITGERYIGIPKWVPPATVTGKPIAELDPPEDWPIRIITYKSALQTHSRLSSNYHLREIWPTNWVEMNLRTAEEIGLAEGDEVWVITPHGRRKGKVKTRQGIVPGVITFAVGYGHWGYGATRITIGDTVMEGDPYRRAGIHLNPVMRRDPAIWQMPVMDTIGGSAAFYQTRARLEKATGA